MSKYGGDRKRRAPVHDVCAKPEAKKESGASTALKTFALALIPVVIALVRYCVTPLRTYSRRLYLE